MTLEEILPKLQEWFPPEDHKERTIKGGGKWWFIPYQCVVERLNRICPADWHEDYVLSHREADGDPIYLCKLTICGVTRVGIGDKSNEDSPYGTPAQRSFRKAFMDAAEKFGILSYLDDQKDDRTKRNFVNYMAKGGNLKPAQEYQKQTGQATARRSSDPRPKPFGQPATPKPATPPKPAATPPQPQKINEDQRSRFWTIARLNGFTDAGVKALIEAYSFASTADITVHAYDGIVEKLQDPDYKAMYNEKGEIALMNAALANGAKASP